MQLLYVRLPRDQREALIRFAEREYRYPSDQAAYFVAEGLRRAGALPVDHRLAAAGAAAGESSR